MDVLVWLRTLGLLERYEAAFRDNEIDETVLPNLTAEDLKDLGVGIVGHRRKLLDAITALRTDATPKDTSRDAVSSPPSRHPKIAPTPPGHGDVLGPGRSTALSARMDPEDFGFVRRMATLIGAAFVACALVYL